MTPVRTIHDAALRAHARAHATGRPGDRRYADTLLYRWQRIASFTPDSELLTVLNDSRRTDR